MNLNSAVTEAVKSVQDAPDDYAAAWVDDAANTGAAVVPVAGAATAAPTAAPASPPAAPNANPAATYSNAWNALR